MFGIFRYILSLMVVYAHLTPRLEGFKYNWTGAYAVFCFYILSGYLMTLVLNQRYGFEFSGLKKYFKNRLLRIYPLYLLVFFLSVPLTLFLPQLTSSVNPGFAYPTSLSNWVANLFIIDFWLPNKSLVVYSAWSLKIELVFYALISVLGRSSVVVCFWFFSSLLYTVLNLSSPFEERYFTYLAASLPFSAGALIYFLKPKLELNFLLLGSSLLVFLMNIILFQDITVDTFSTRFYFSFLLGIIIIMQLACLKAGPAPAWLLSLDNFLGKLSYPIFINHILVATIIIYLFGFPNRSIALFVAAFLPINFFSLIMHMLVETRINKIRELIKSS